MTKANFHFNYHYFGSKTIKIEIIRGMVTLKNDGKLSFSIFDFKHLSSAQRYQAKAAVTKAVAADFVSPSADGLVTFFDVEREQAATTSLLALLKEKTVDFREQYLLQTRQWSAKSYARMKQFIMKPIAEHYSNYGIKTEEAVFFDGKKEMVPVRNKTFYRFKNLFDEYVAILQKPYKEYENKQLIMAERHYNDATEKLAIRLNRKGSTN